MNFIKNKQALESLKKPKAVVFDWDNTLVDTWPLIQTAIDETMKKMGKEPWGLKKVRDNVHKSMRESFPEIFGDDWKKAGEIYKQTYRSLHLEKLYLLPGALELIKKLEEMQISQFVVSNKMGPTLRQEAEKIGLDKKFFSLIGAGDAKADKPSFLPVEMALIGSDIKLRQDEIWFVGDTIADIECAYNSCCTPIIYGNAVDNEISKTIPQDWIESGKNNEGPLPVYFHHQELIEVLKK